MRMRPAVDGRRASLVVVVVLAQRWRSPSAQRATRRRTATPTHRRRDRQDGVQHLHFEYGPLDIQPGPERRSTPTSSRSRSRQKTAGSSASSRTCGWPTARCRRSTCSTCTTACGPTRTRRDATAPLFPERFIAAGEEKTALELPAGLRLPVPRVGRRWYLNYMIHNLTPKPYTVSLTYDVDFVPATSPQAAA